MAGRWGIGEWFGRDIETMTPDERASAARFALQLPPEWESDAPECPFMSTINPGSPCNKKGGVCSLRAYEEKPTRITSELPATVCPSRFLERGSDGSIFKQIAQVLFDSTDDVWVIKEIPFLQKVMSNGKKERTASAGRIDWVITEGRPTLAQGPLEWAALETQAVYFSGGAFEPDFKAYLDSPPDLVFPIKQRRPDYRSSGAKRLAPQLDVKVPVMRRWGKKTVVVIDKGFANEMSPLDVISDDVDGCEVVLAIVNFSDDMTLTLEQVILTELDSIVSALQARFSYSCH